MGTQEVPPGQQNLRTYEESLEFIPSTSRRSKAPSLPTCEKALRQRRVGSRTGIVYGHVPSVSGESWQISCGGWTMVFSCWSKGVIHQAASLEG